MSLTRKDFLKAAATTVGSMACAGLHAETGSQSAPGAGMSKKAPTKGVTQEVVSFIANARIDQFPADVVHQGKRCLIDGFGVVLAGSTLEGSRIVREYVKAGGGQPGSHVLGGAMQAPVELAALADGASGHAMDYDDTQLSTTPDRTFGLLTHPTVPALASALAVSEQLGVSGQEFLHAFLVGFEVECKIAEAIFPDHYNRGFHSTGTLGTF